MQYNSIESFCTKINTSEVFLESAFEGCSQEEVEEIETCIKYSLPITIREFLMFCGKRWKGTYVLHSLQKTLLSEEPYQILRESISRSSVKQGLKTINVDDIVILKFEEHIGDYNWSFIYKNDKCANPKVTSIYYEELSEDVYSFTEFIKMKLETAIKFSVTPHLPDYMRFQRAMEYINPKAVKRLHLSSYEFASKIAELFSKLPNVEEVTINYTPHSDDSWEINLPNHDNIRKLKIFAGIKKLKFPEKGFEKLETLELKCNTFLHFPKNINRNENLTTLKLTCCELKNVPDEVYIIRSLKELVLFRNDISSIDEKIQNLVNLETLNINDNSFSTEKLDFLQKLLPNVQILHYRQKN